MADLAQMVARATERLGSGAALAMALGEDERTIRAWQTGEARPGVRAALRLARWSGASPRDVFEASGLDVNMLLPETEASSTPEAREIRARILRRLEKDDGPDPDAPPNRGCSRMDCQEDMHEHEHNHKHWQYSAPHDTRHDNA